MQLRICIDFSDNVTPNSNLCFSWYQQRLTLPLVDQFIADLKDSVREAKVAPSGKGSMVAVYGALLFPLLFLCLHPLRCLSCTRVRCGFVVSSICLVGAPPALRCYIFVFIFIISGVFPYLRKKIPPHPSRRYTFLSVVSCIVSLFLSVRLPPISFPGSFFPSGSHSEYWYSECSHHAGSCEPSPHVPPYTYMGGNCGFGTLGRPLFRIQGLGRCFRHQP
ncbi:hypothetical protein BDZ97DRAFT_1348546 [Flammula alnicola]|nr:hypothetical protein BDZ97DRAFT_1348546 [Flammula alnicola]